ncbi:Bromodomain-containing protein [Ochromonadaceae sp. CCMP2298]|nr:Bromodomain-containing protein [Ochromonadaceae sp. CCMP2298]
MSSEDAYFEEYKTSVPARIRQFDAHIAKVIAAQTGAGAGARAGAGAGGGAGLSVDADMRVRCLSLLRSLVEDVRTEPFWAPVDVSVIPSYPHYISHPMDLGTITTRVKGAGYDEEQFAKDVRLVWANCQTFNVEQSVLYGYASILGDKFERLFDAWITSPSRPQNPDIQD